MTEQYEQYKAKLIQENAPICFTCRFGTDILYRLRLCQKTNTVHPEVFGESCPYYKKKVMP